MRSPFIKSAFFYFSAALLFFAGAYLYAERTAAQTRTVPYFNFQKFLPTSVPLGTEFEGILSSPVSIPRGTGSLDVVLVLDTSGSMNQNLAQSTELINEIIRDLTLRDLITDMLEELEDVAISKGHSAILSALREALTYARASTPTTSTVKGMLAAMAKAGSLIFERRDSGAYISILADFRVEASYITDSFIVDALFYTKLEFAKTALNDFIGVLNQASDRVAFVTFNGDEGAVLRTSFTNNFSRVASFVDWMWAGGKTPMGDGLRAGARVFSGGSSASSKYIIFASDGLENVPPYVADTIAEVPADVSVYTIAIGAGADEDILQKIATTAGSRKGEYFSSENVAELVDVYNDVVRTLTAQYLTNTVLEVQLQPEFSFVSAIPPPASQAVSPTTGLLKLSWNYGDIFDGDVIDIAMTLRPNLRLLNQPQVISQPFPYSQLLYTDPLTGSRKTTSVPGMTITVTDSGSGSSSVSQSCTSSPNICGMRNQGYVQANGTCSAPTPADSLCFSQVTFEATPRVVRNGSLSALTWTSRNMTQCIVTGPSVYYNSLSGNDMPTGPITERTRFYITCRNSNTGAEESAVVDVNVRPTYLEI